MDLTLDQSLNIGPEVTLAEGLTKHVKIGSVKVIREVRQKMKDIPYRFAFCVGREKRKLGDEEVDFPAIEASYREAFGMVLVEGLTDEEYENANVQELDTLLDRFLY
nr:hypothetical protein [Cohnella kolymensis]